MVGPRANLAIRLARGGGNRTFEAVFTVTAPDAERCSNRLKVAGQLRTQQQACGCDNVGPWGGYEKKSSPVVEEKQTDDGGQPEHPRHIPPAVIVGSVGDVIAFIDQRPAERDTVLFSLQRYRGNSFVQEVVDEMRAKQAQEDQKHAGFRGLGVVTTQGMSAMHHVAATPAVQAPAHDHKKPTSEQLLDHAQASGNALLGQFVPGYIAARDRLDANAVASIGGQLSGVATHFYGALAAHAETPGDQTTEIKAQILKSLQPAVTAALASGLPPQMFRGRLVGPSPVAVEFSNAPNARHLPKLLGELERTIRMIELVHKLDAKFAPGAKAREDVHALAAARIEVVDWSGRALDLLFLKATLGPIWELLDSTATPMDPKPSRGLNVASKEAARVGWLGDTGKFDLPGATAMLQGGGRDNATLVLHDLYTSDPDTRAKFLMGLRQNKVLDSFCNDLTWEEVKQLHDSLGNGFAEIKTELQRHFIGDSKYGPSLGEEFENHDRSLYSLIDKVPLLGDGLNFALDVGTFGFHSSYGRALDDYSNGRTSPNEANSAQAHALMRTAAIALVSTVTGGLAGKMVRGGAKTASSGQATLSGAAAGSVGASAAVGTSDLYNNLVSKTQIGASSPEDYIKAMLLGGTLGGAFEFAGAKLGAEKAALTSGEAPTPKLLPPGAPPQTKNLPNEPEIGTRSPVDETEAAEANSAQQGHNEPTKQASVEPSKARDTRTRTPRGKKPYRGDPPKPTSHSSNFSRPRRE